MKKLKKGITNSIYLDTEKTVDSASISILDRKGNFLQKADETDINELSCSLDAEIGKYKIDIEFHSDTIPGYYNIFWGAQYSSINVVLEDEFSPEDLLIEDKIAVDSNLVLPSFVMDTHLRGIEISEIESSFNSSYRSVLREQIATATTELETETAVYFTKRLIEGERHDYDMTPIYEKYFTNTLFHSPVISVEKAALKLNNLDIVKEIPNSWVQVGNSLEGLIKIMPFAGGYSGLSFIFTSGFGLAILLGGQNYIPDFFSYDYYAGLDWDNLLKKEKSAIMTAISRRTAINMLPNLDVHRGISSESDSIDGVSQSVSYTSSATFGEHSAAIENFKKQEDRWIQNFKKRYLTRLIVG